MKCKVNWTGQGGMGFWAHTGSGHAVMMDGPVTEGAPGGGHDMAPRPMEMVLAGAGGCTAYDVVLILQRGRQQVTGCTVALQAERADVDPKVFTRINMHYVVTGKGLSHDVVARAIALSHEKYCSASIMLSKTADITTSFEVVDA